MFKNNTSLIRLQKRATIENNILSSFCT